MKVESLYVVAFTSDTEAVKVAVGLFYRHAPKAINALAVYAPDKVREGQPVLYQMSTLKKGEPVQLRVLSKSKNTNLRDAINLAPEELEAVPEPEKRASVGMYLVIHGTSFKAEAGYGASLISRIQPIIESAGAPKVICLVRCFAAPPADELPNEKALPDESSTIIVEDMLIALNKVGCKPLITAWSTVVSAYPGKIIGGTVPFGAKLVQGELRIARPTAQTREQYKFGYYVNGDNKIIVLPASKIQDHYLAD
jgi:hypothetical protein